VNRSLIVYIIPGETFKGIENFRVDNTFKLGRAITHSRVKKTKLELDMLQIASNVSNDAHKNVMKDTIPGLYEYNVMSYFLFYSANCGLFHQAYNPIVGSGTNSAILHYTANTKQLGSSEFVLIDAGAEFMGYGSDVTRTFPSNGKFTDDQKLIYNMVLNVSITIEGMMRPGTRWGDLFAKATRMIGAELLAAGFLQGDLDDIISKGVVGLFYPHGLGHYLGLDVHDSGVYDDLEEGNVLTIEPGIYFNQAFLEMGYNNVNQAPYLVREKINQFANIGGVRIEDDIIVTKDGIKIITDVPKTVEAIESLMANKK